MVVFWWSVSEQPQIDVIMQSFFSKLHSTAASFQVMIIIFSASILTHILEVRACYAAVEVFLSKKFFRLFLHEICICTPSLLSTDDFQLICHYFLTNSFKCNNVSLLRLYSIIIDCMINFLKVFLSTSFTRCF